MDSQLRNLLNKRVLNAREEAQIRQAFCDNVSPKIIAYALGLSERCIRQRYQNLRGYSLKPRQLEKTLEVRRRRQDAKELPSGIKKPLVNPARFYKSTFEPV